MARFTEKQRLQIKKDRDRKRKSGNKNASLTISYPPPNRQGQGRQHHYKNDGDPTVYTKRRDGNTSRHDPKAANPIDSHVPWAQEITRESSPKRHERLWGEMHHGGRGKGKKAYAKSEKERPAREKKQREMWERNKMSHKEYQALKRRLGVR
tara:strand:+ start:166 stop:621 length:456 start_codon:yes stop_codon:yes gene_type:complete